MTGAATDTRSVEEVIARALFERDEREAQSSHASGIYVITPWEKARDIHRYRYLADASAILTALKDEGMVVVPKEPTDKMIEAAHFELTDAIMMYQNNAVRAAAVYRAMISAAEDQHGDKQ